MTTEQLSMPTRIKLLEQWRKEFPETVDLKIKNAVNGAVIKLLLGIGGLLTVQSILERVLAGSG